MEAAVEVVLEVVVGVVVDATLVAMMGACVEVDAIEDVVLSSGGLAVATDDQLLISASVQSLGARFGNCSSQHF